MKHSLIQFLPYLLEPTANFTTPLPKSHIPNRTHFSSIHEPMCPAKPKEPVLNLPLGCLCFLLQHLALSPHFSTHCGLSPPQLVTQLFSYISFPSFATVKAKMVLSSLLQSWCYLPQPCFNSSWAAPDSASSLVWAAGHVHWTLCCCPCWELGDSEVSLTMHK